MIVTIRPRARSLAASSTIAYLLALVVLLGNWAPAQAEWGGGTPAERSSPAVMKAYRKVVAVPSHSTVRIKCNGKNKDVALGTIVAADGWIITKASLLKGDIVCELKNQESHKAKLIGVDDKHDLALLKIEAKDLQPIQWAHSKTAEAGNLLASPGLGELPVAIGVVSVATREPSLREMSVMAPNPDAGFMGVRFENVRTGPTIREVIPQGPAAKAGLKKGDVIIRVAGRPVSDPDKVIALVQGYKPNEVILVRIKREDSEKTIKVKLGRRPSDLLDRSDEMNRMGSRLSNRRGGFPVILQHDTVIKPTDCGGPLVGLDGKAVGVNIARAGRTESYAIPAERVQSLLSDLKSGKFAPVEAINEEKVLELETEIKTAKSDIRKAQVLLQDEDSEQKQNALKETIATLRKKITKAEADLAKLRGDATRKPSPRP